ncbi:hypothetical protein, partial [Pseudoduganella ginsengisoli]|uniref:hypothetical protein n=1 Tax=Pseudoduganella ginsengisoli TaxID=1462440 RepID=UPI001BAC526B
SRAPASAPAAAAPPAIATPQPEQPARSAAAEWQQLAPYVKSPLQIFALTETRAGLHALPGVVGVYQQPAPRPGPMRLRVALRPDSPVRLSVGAYTVQLQLTASYIERRTCQVASCNGEMVDTVKKTGKTVRLRLAPQNGYVAETTLPFTQATGPDQGDAITYADLVLTVRRMTISPVRR